MDGEEGPRTGRYWPMFIGFPTIRSGAGELHSDFRSQETPSNGFSESPDLKSFRRLSELARKASDMKASADVWRGFPICEANPCLQGEGPQCSIAAW